MKKKLKKVAVVFGIVIASLVTLYVLICSWVNWSGARAWEDARARLEAENVELDFRKLLPEMPPEDQNFARVPLLASLTDFTQDRPTDLSEMFENNGEIIYENPKLRDRVVELKLPEVKDFKKPYLPLWEVAREANMENAPDIRGLLNEFAPEIAEIDAAAELPYAQIKLNVGETFAEHVSTVLPFLQEYREIQKVETLRACRAIEAGDRKEALSALKVSFQLGRASTSHVTLIGYLVGQAHYSNAYSIIWLGMKKNLWEEADLAWIQDELSKLDVLGDLEYSLNFEMSSFQIGAADFMKSVSVGDSRHLVKLVGTLEGGNSSSSLGMLALITPTGIWDHNKAFGVNVMLDHSILPVRNRTLPDPDGVEKAFEKRGPYNFLAGITLPASSNLVKRGFYGEVAGDLAETACALERYQLKNGDYPEKLEALVPEFIAKVPDDLLEKGQPLKYNKLDGAARYQLYSVGENGTDEGGRVAVKAGKPPRQDREQGDWVWSYVLDSIRKK